MFPIHSFLLPYTSFIWSLFPSDLQLGFLFFLTRIIFSTTTASATGLVNWCWQPKFNLQLRHLTEHSSRSVSNAKYNHKPKQFHHLLRNRSWNTKHSSTVNLIRRTREELYLWSGGTWVRGRGDVLACQGLKYARPCLCAVWSRLYEEVYGSADISEIKHSSGLIIFPCVKVKLTYQPTLLPARWKPHSVYSRGVDTMTRTPARFNKVQEKTTALR